MRVLAFRAASLTRRRLMQVAQQIPVKEQPCK